MVEQRGMTMLGVIAGDIFGGLPERRESEIRAAHETDLLEVVDRFGVHLRPGGPP